MKLIIVLLVLDSRPIFPGYFSLNKNIEMLNGVERIFNDLWLLIGPCQILTKLMQIIDVIVIVSRGFTIIQGVENCLVFPGMV